MIGKDDYCRKIDAEWFIDGPEDTNSAIEYPDGQHLKGWHVCWDRIEKSLCEIEEHMV